VVYCERQTRVDCHQSCLAIPKAVQSFQSPYVKGFKPYSGLWLTG